LGLSILRLRDTEWLSTQSPFYIYPFVILAAFFTRPQYYFGFMVAEGAAIISGLGYNGNDAEGKAKWNAACGIDVWSFETANSYSMASNAWNMQTSVWLKRYIYFRAPRGNIAMFSTYVVSAFWHGFYPGYYIFFVSIAIVTTQVYRRILLYVSPVLAKLPPFLYNAISVVATVGTMNYFVVSFLILDAQLTWNAFSSMHFFLHWACLGLGIILAILEVVSPPPPQAPRSPGGSGLSTPTGSAASSAPGSPAETHKTK